jgi:Zn-finger nucleic acid-binding protein
MPKLCPICRQTLATIRYLGFQIETCPQCGGLWLNRSVMQKIVVAVMAATQKILS